MESAAIANAAFVNGIALLVIRTISDLADDASRETYDNNMQRAADIGAKIVMRVLDNFAQ
jgi:nucleoside phosphorylase